MPRLCGEAPFPPFPKQRPRIPVQYCMAAILHCVNLSAQRKHVCFGRFGHFVQSPDPNTLISLVVNAVVSSVGRFVPRGKIFPLHALSGLAEPNGRAALKTFRSTFSEFLDELHIWHGRATESIELRDRQTFSHHAKEDKNTQRIHD